MIFAENINNQVAGNGISGVLVFKIFWGGMSPYPPSKASTKGARVSYTIAMTTQISLATLLYEASVGSGYQHQKGAKVLLTT